MQVYQKAYPLYQGLYYCAQTSLLMPWADGILNLVMLTRLLIETSKEELSMNSRERLQLALDS